MANTFKRRSKKLKAARNMPPLYHRLPDKSYDVSNSQTVGWLIQQPEILEFLWDQFKQSDDVSYNPETGKWQGVDYEN